MVMLLTMRCWFRYVDGSDGYWLVGLAIALGLSGQHCQVKPRIEMTSIYRPQAKIDLLTKQVEALTKMMNVSNRTGSTTFIRMDGSLDSGDEIGEFSSHEELNDVR